MRLRTIINKFSDCRGQSILEFTLCAFLTVMLLLAVFEISNMMLVYTTVANAARAGARYAITHSSVPGTSVTSSNVSTLQSNVTTVVTNFLSTAPLDTSTATTTVTYPSEACSGSPSTCTGTTAGNLVSVTVSYPYRPFISYLPLPHLTLTSTSEGVITW
jgi:Flp pilus assembly protein TadG